MRHWFVIALLVTLLPLLVYHTSSAIEDFGIPQPGRHLYDRARVLTPDQQRDLEARAAAIHQAGTPIVIYLRIQDASFEKTVADARALMDAWDIQSAPGARDGVVLFFNLTPSDPRHGHFAVVAGETHVRSGALNQRQLDRIAAAMLLSLREGRLAEGIAVGLDAIYQNITIGPPPEPRNWWQRVADTLTRQNLNLIWIIATLLVLAWGTVLWVRRAQPSVRSPVVTTTEPPSDLPPALAGALLQGRVVFDLMLATFFDLARRGAFSLRLVSPAQADPTQRAEHAEPAPSTLLVQVHLQNPEVIRSDFERVVWESFKSFTNQPAIPVQTLRTLLWEHWPAAQRAIRSELIHRGWFDPNIRRRRIAFLIPGAVGLLLGIVALAIVLLAESPSGALGVFTLLPSGLLWLVVANLLHETTPQGEEEARRWRGFMRGVKQAARQRTASLDLDQLLPFAIALGIHKDLGNYLRTGPLHGYVPIWLESDQPLSDDGDALLDDFLTMMQKILQPSTSSATSDSSDGGGGASDGSAASGGDF